ncbi:MAG: hypothetical protein F6J90_17555 [Moorea sp. SIOASIH]|nr:hypothetical protein [Moorena sp. SIOASIH]
MAILAIISKDRTYPLKRKIKGLANKSQVSYQPSAVSRQPWPRYANGSRYLRCFP